MRARHLLIITILASSSRAWAQARGAFLSDLTWPEAEARFQSAPVVIVPFGAGAKEHGPHLPLSADQITLDHLLKVAVDSTNVLVAPPILTGWFPAFREFPGTDIADPDVFKNYAYEVAASLVRHGAKRVLFLNTGIRNSTGLPLAIAARDLHTRTGVPTLLISWNDLETAETAKLQQQKVGGHADEIETSIILALRPDLVHVDRAVTDYHGALGPSAPGYQPGGYSRDPKSPEYSTTGVTGDAKLATAEKGRKALAIMDAQLILALRAFLSARIADGR